MILFTELLSLLEAPARVHVNGKLSVLADLIAKDFGKELYNIPFMNKCLIGQFVYTMSARTGLSMSKCIEVFLDQYIHYPNDVIRRMSRHGVTPQELIDVYNGRLVKVNNKKFKLRCSFHSYHSEEELAKAVEAGNPVIIPFAVNSKFSDGIENHDDDGKFNSMFADAEHYKSGVKDYHHSVLAIGVDRESNEIILRDIRPDYLYNGYVKVPMSVIKKQIPLTFSFDVDLEEAHKKLP